MKCYMFSANYNTKTQQKWNQQPKTQNPKPSETKATGQQKPAKTKKQKPKTKWNQSHKPTKTNKNQQKPKTNKNQKPKAKSQVKPKPKAKSQKRSSKKPANSTQIRDFSFKMHQIARKAAPGWQNILKNPKKYKTTQTHTKTNYPSDSNERGWYGCDSNIGPY